ncbi:helix-turn-helix transcriptional regulator [Paenibacillus tundrae]|uniref:helix-turn-helix transcriptional regulator n=1 Tax=Paenibacillus tundrae TaxID=528187 RepID=UPI0030CF11C2
MNIHIGRKEQSITNLEKETWTSRTYREAALQHILTRIPYDAYCFTTVDPHTLLSTGAVTEDGIEAIHDHLFLNEYTEEDLHKYADMIRSGKHTAILRAALDETTERSARYETILKPAGFSDELRAVLICDGACWGYLTLYRRTETALFTEEERVLLQDWTGSLARMLRKTQQSLMDEILSGSPQEPGIMVVSDAFKLLSLNEAAEHWLTQLRALEQLDDNVIPRPVRAVSSHLLSRLLRPSNLNTSSEPRAAFTSQSKACIQLLDGRYLVLHASRMRTLDGSGQIAIRLEQAMPQDLLPLLADSHGLSDRERELLGYVLRSYSSKEIAAAMFISAYTVQDHLKSIFAKTGVYSRRELIWFFVSRFHLSDNQMN